jgi:uncharacterized membrane protein HdeD (DUF308 family)
VSASKDGPAVARAYWPVPILRAAPAILLAVFITFTADHSPAVGLVAFGIFAALSGAIVAVASWRMLAPGVTRTLFVAQGVVTVLAGIAALVLSDDGITFLLVVLTSFAIVTGALELFAGLRNRGKTPLARDWVFVGALTLLLAIAVLLVPAGLQQQFTGPDHVARVLTASVFVVGLLGAYSAILGVYLVIAGLSLKWAGQPARTVPLAERSN